MDKLNLPEFECKIEKLNDKLVIFDFIRKKYVVLTPEEWVRQHFVHFLVTRFHYPKSLIRLEGGLRYNTLARRSDIVVYDRRAKPYMIIECKAASVNISQKVFKQVAAYNKTLGANFIVVTNGLVHFCCEIDHVNGNYQFLDAIPSFEFN